MKGRRPAGVRVGGLVVSTHEVRQPVAAELVPVEPGAELVPAERVWVPVAMPPPGRGLRARRAAIVAGGVGLGSGMFVAAGSHPVVVGAAAGAAMLWVAVGDFRHRRRPLHEVVAWESDLPELDKDEVRAVIEARLEQIEGEELELDRQIAELGAALLQRADEALARRQGEAAGEVAP